MLLHIQSITVGGPGPHKINSDENIEEQPDINLLPQRDAPIA